MTMRKGWPAKKAATDADDTRGDLRSLVTLQVDGTPKTGISSYWNSLFPVSATATMNVSVGTFAAVAARDGGAVLLSNDGPVNVLLDPAPVANSRIDLIYAKQNDSSSTVTVPDANDLPVIGVVKGTAASSPTKPALPVGAVELGSVLVPAGVTATNQDGVVINRPTQFTAANGAPVPFLSLADLNNWALAGGFQLAEVIADSSNTNNNGLYLSIPGIGWRATGGYSLPPLALPGLQAGWTAPGCRFTQIGRLVVGHWVFVKNAQATFNELITVLPAALRPVDAVALPCGVVNGTAEGLSLLTVGTDGGVRVGMTPAANARTFKVDFVYMLT